MADKLTWRTTGTGKRVGFLGTRPVAVLVPAGDGRFSVHRYISTGNGGVGPRVTVCNSLKAAQDVAKVVFDR